MKRMKKMMAVLLGVLIAVMGICTNAMAIKKGYDMPYYITADLTNQIVTVYNTSNNEIVRQMLCSSGLNDATPTGTYYLPRKEQSDERREWFYFPMFGCYAKYATRIFKGILFHSLTYNSKLDSSLSKKAVEEFGLPASHGCLRLRADDAKFIAENCLAGTYCKIYKSKERDTDLWSLLLESSYTGDNGMSYEDFIGMCSASGDLGRYSEGTAVSDLQTRMRALGYYDGDISGVYQVKMITAIKKLQSDLGLPKTGVASAELQEVIYSDTAPLSNGLTLTDGYSGPVVKKLQTALTTLGIYTGNIDSVYDVEVADAVKLFQSAYHSEADGIATPELQQAVYYELNNIEGKLGSLDGLQLAVNRETATLGTVVSTANVLIREKPSTSSNKLGKVSNGDVVLIYESNKEWSRVQIGSVVGFIRNKYLKGYTQDNIVLTYTSPNSTESYNIGYTLAEYASGATSFAARFSEYYASESFQENDIGNVHYATVNTGSDSISLNMREEDKPDSAVLEKLYNGTQLRVLSRASGWTLVSYNGKIGYLMDDYLTFWEGESDALNPASEETGEDNGTVNETGEMETVYAIVVAAGGKAGVYDADSDDAAVLGALPAGTQVQVVKASEDDDWVLISYKDHQGYMKDTTLQFQVSE